MRRCALHQSLQDVLRRSPDRSRRPTTSTSCARPTACSATEHRVAGSQLLGLLDEDRRGLESPRRHRGSDVVGAVAHDHDDLLRLGGITVCRTCHRTGRPQMGCRTLGVEDFSRLPLPAASTTAASVRGGSWSRPTARPEVEGSVSSHIDVGRVPGGGIEPPSQAPKARVLPLDHPGRCRHDYGATEAGCAGAGGPLVTIEPGTARASRSACDRVDASAATVGPLPLITAPSAPASSNRSIVRAICG